MTPGPTQAPTASRASRRVVGARVAILFDEHAGMVLGLCRLLLRDHHEAEDAAQQTFVSAYRSLLRGTEPRDPAPWLAAIARNECRARLRKRMRAPIALDGEVELELSDTTDLAELADRRAELAQLASEIAKLPSRQREALALRDFLGLSYEEVASTLKVSVPVVESLLFRARRRLRDTVRTVPRYAAGLVVVPIALRAAVSRDVPELDAITVGLGIAGLAGAAAGGIAKLLSLPASVKVAATVAVVATGSVVAPTLIAPAEHGAAPPAAVQGEDREAGAPVADDVSPTATPPKAEAPPTPSAPEPASAPAAAPTEPAAEPEPPANADPGRISSGVPGPAPLPPPPPPPPPPASDETTCPTPGDEAGAEDGEIAAEAGEPGCADAASPSEEPPPADDSGAAEPVEEPVGGDGGEEPPGVESPPAPPAGTGWVGVGSDSEDDDASPPDVEDGAGEADADEPDRS